MRRNYKILVPLVLLAGVLVSFKFHQKNKPNPEKNRAVLQVVKYILTEGHYQPKAFDDNFSESVFDSYLELLDPTKRYFYKQDIDSLSMYKYDIDDQIILDDLTFFYAAYHKYKLRVEESQKYIDDILTQPFNLEVEESLSLDYENIDYPDNELEMLDRWRKHLKWRYISTLYDKEVIEEDKAKEDDTYLVQSISKLKEEALKKTRENMDDLMERYEDMDEEDYFGMFINTITTAFEPHTNYFDPKLKKRFDQSMSGKLEGIGARLQKEGEYTKVSELISGGPAWRAGELEVGDIILKVAQADEEPLDIVGMRLDDAIEFIKGKKGTEVKLTLKKVDGTIKVISIIRDVVELEETFVKSSVIQKEGRKYGLINLPKFYFDMNDRTFHNSATDMEQEINRLKDENVEGILIDLRNNGGGSLRTAVEISGMFIDKGPVVQVKFRGEKARVNQDHNSGTLWDGPLAILVDESSASASEIFAAAMQDYGRAVIIGTEQTYGKGTVQNFYELNDYFNYPEDLGSLKMTIQKFYRIDGGSTQLKGVKPDVVVPSRYDFLDIGEKDENHPMEWDRIESVKFSRWNGYLNRDEVISQAQNRVDTLSIFNLIEQSANFLSENKKDTTMPLNYSQYKADIADNDVKAEAFDAIDEYHTGLNFYSPQYELILMEQDSLLAEKRNRWHKNLQDDVYVDEGIRVLEDLKTSSDTRLVKK
jgi:carboxyl-terminal processing protease